MNSTGAATRQLKPVVPVAPVAPVAPAPTLQNYDLIFLQKFEHLAREKRNNRLTPSQVAQFNAFCERLNIGDLLEI